MKKYKKIISILICFCIVSLLLIFPVSAFSVSEFSITFVDYWTAKLNPTYEENWRWNNQILEHGNGFDITTTYVDGLYRNEDYYSCYYFTSSGGYGTLCFDVNIGYADVENQIYCNDVGVYIYGALINANNDVAFSYSSITGFSDKVHFEYTGTIPTFFYVQLPFTVVEDTSLINATFHNFSFTPYNSTNDIIANAESNKNQIISNQEKNSSDIQKNQDENTDKTLYGKDYDSVDGSKVDDYVESEAKLMDSLTNGFDEVNDWFSGVTGNVSSGTASALSFISVFMTKFLNIPELSSIYKIALTFGMFSFVVGSTLLVVGLYGGIKRRDETRLYRAAQMKSYKSRTK